MRKKFFYLFFILIIIGNSYSNICLASQSSEDIIASFSTETKIENITDLDIKTDHVLMMERSTGDILYDKNGDERMYPASTTKILTAILVLENCSLNETAEVTSLALKAVPSGYTTCGIQIGEEFKIKDVLYTMLIRSANDAANVLAIHVSGSITGFAELMNKKAKELGCTASHFTNPSGIHDNEHYTSAHDLAIIANYAMNNPIFRDTVLTSSYSLPATDIYPHENRSFKTSNKLINPDEKDYYYNLATGIKTGFTNASKDCIVASAKKNGIEFIVVVLGAESINGVRQKYIDCKTLFDFAFDNYITHYTELQEKKDSNFNPFISSDENDDINDKIEIAEGNEIIEDNTIQINSQEVSAKPIETEEFEFSDFQNEQNKFSPLIIVVIFLVCIIIALSIIIFILFKKRNIRISRGKRRRR